MIEPMDIITALEIDMSKAVLRSMTDAAFCKKVGVSPSTFRRVYRTVDDSGDVPEPDRRASIKVVNEFAGKLADALRVAGCTFTEGGCVCLPGLTRSGFKVFSVEPIQDSPMPKEGE